MKVSCYEDYAYKDKMTSHVSDTKILLLPCSAYLYCAAGRPGSGSGLGVSMGSWDTVRWAGQWAGHASPSPPPDSSLASVAQLSAESVLEVVRWCVLVMAARVACHGRGITRVTCYSASLGSCHGMSVCTKG